MEQFNPGLRNLVNLGKNYEKSVTGEHLTVVPIWTIRVLLIEHKGLTLGLFCFVCFWWNEQKNTESLKDTVTHERLFSRFCALLKCDGFHFSTIIFLQPWPWRGRCISMRCPRLGRAPQCRPFLENWVSCRVAVSSLSSLWSYKLPFLVYLSCLSCQESNTTLKLNRKKLLVAHRNFESDMKTKQSWLLENCSTSFFLIEFQQGENENRQQNLPLRL